MIFDNEIAPKIFNLFKEFMCHIDDFMINNLKQFLCFYLKYNRDIQCAFFQEYNMNIIKFWIFKYPLKTLEMLYQICKQSQKVVVSNPFFLKYFQEIFYY